MGLFFNHKNICFRIVVSYENQSRLTNFINPAFRPLYDLRKNQHYSVKFTHSAFVCTCLKSKQDFSYKQIQKAEVISDGVIIYLENGRYVAIATEILAKHNCELSDIVALLNRRCRFRFTVTEPLCYPELEDDGRYKSDQLPVMQISFSLTGNEIKRLLWYDYLFSERALVFVVPFAVFLVLSAVFSHLGLLLVALIIAAFQLALSIDFFKTLDGYVKNHQGDLYLLMYDELLVVRLHDTDLELEYNSMRRKKSLFGLWQLRCGDFFTLVLPQRIIAENPIFFETLYAQINKKAVK